MGKLRLYATGEQVNGHEAVNVTAGGADEEYWRSLGYAPEAQESFSSDSEDASGAPAGGGASDEEWTLKASPAEYLERYADTDPGNMSDAVAERLALARKLVAEKGAD